MTVVVKQGPTLQPSKYSTAKGVYKASYEWLIEVEFPPANPIEVLPEVVVSALVNQLPVEGAPHPFVPLAYCDATGCEQVKGGFYKYVATYTDEHSDADKNKPGKNEDPIEDLPIIRPLAGIKSIPIHRDVDGKAILNAAKDVMIDEAERQTFGFAIRKNVLYLPAWVEDLVDSKSSTDIEIRGYKIEKGKARFILPEDYLSEPKRRNGIEYYEFKFEIRVDKRDDHDGKLLNAGFIELVAKVDENGDPVLDDNNLPIYERRRIREQKDGSEPTEAVPLDPATGARLKDPTPDNVDYVTVKRYHIADYSALPGIQPGGA